jgi:hypothetical protein
MPLALERESAVPTQLVQSQRRTDGREKRAAELVSIASTVEVACAASAVVLAILGLAGASPTTMVAVGSILLGTAILFQGGAEAARYRRMIREMLEPALAGLHTLEVGGGIAAESLAGIAGIAFGVIALLSAASVTLCAVALVAFGAAEVLGSAAMSRYDVVAIVSDVSISTRQLLKDAVRLSSGVLLLVGIVAIVLGILALLGFAPVALILVGILSVGGAILLGGAAVGARALGDLRHSGA